MKFILFVEGYTEKEALAPFLKKWLDQHLTKPVGIKPVRFQGWAELVEGSPTKAKLHLSQPEVIAVIALLDLYGPDIYPSDRNTTKERYQWGKEFLESKANQSNFFQFFAVHEVETWLFSDPSIFPNSIQPSIQKISSFPEEINNIKPPAKRLDEIYKAQKKTYKKTTSGKDLFQKLDPAIAYEKCPYLRVLLDEMLKMAKLKLHRKKMGRHT